MFHKRSRRAALMLALLLTALPAWASENKVCCVAEPCNGPSCKVNIVGGFGGPGSAEALGPEGVAAWAKEHKITGLDPHHWAAPLLVGLIGAGIVLVDDGDHLDLDAPVTFWYASRVVTAMTKQPTEGLSPREIAVRAVELGLMPGPAPAEDRPLTRLDAAYLAGRMIDFPGTVEEKAGLDQVFTDWEAIPAESGDLIYWVTIKNRLFVGYPDRTFRPTELFTFAQYAAIQQRLRAWWPDQGPQLDGR